MSVKKLRLKNFSNSELHRFELNSLYREKGRLISEYYSRNGDSDILRLIESGDLYIQIYEEQKKLSLKYGQLLERNRNLEALFSGVEPLFRKMPVILLPFQLPIVLVRKLRHVVSNLNNYLRIESEKKRNR